MYKDYVDVANSRLHTAQSTLPLNALCAVCSLEFVTSTYIFSTTVSCRAWDGWCLIRQSDQHAQTGVLCIRSCSHMAGLADVVVTLIVMSQQQDVRHGDICGWFPQLWHLPNQLITTPQTIMSYYRKSRQGCQTCIQPSQLPNSFHT
jgi:hypothetical protein